MKFFRALYFFLAKNLMMLKLNYQNTLCFDADDTLSSTEFSCFIDIKKECVRRKQNCNIHNVKYLKYLFALSNRSALKWAQTAYFQLGG